MQEMKVTQENAESEAVGRDLGFYYGIVYDTARTNAILLEAQATQGRIICSLVSCFYMLPLRILMHVSRRRPQRRIGQADAIKRTNK